MPDGPDLSNLTVDECWALVGGASVGRVALSVAALPVIVLTTYTMSDELVVLEAVGARQIDESWDGSVVALAVDDYDPSTGRGWSVLIRGTTWLLGPAALPLGPPTGGAPDHGPRGVLAAQVIDGYHIAPASRP